LVILLQTKECERSHRGRLREPSMLEAIKEIAGLHLPSIPDSRRKMNMPEIIPAISMIIFKGRVSLPLS